LTEFISKGDAGHDDPVDGREEAGKKTYSTHTRRKKGKRRKIRDLTAPKAQL